jgi:hypothetical protein
MIQHLQSYYMQKNFLKNLYQKVKTIHKLHPSTPKKIYLFSIKKKTYLNYIKIVRKNTKNNQ